MSCMSRGAEGQQEPSLPPFCPCCHQPLPGGHCHPGESANGAGRCWGRFVFSSPVINPWQIRGAPGEQTRPGQSKNASSQPGKQFHVQDSPSPEPLPSWHCLAAPRRCTDKQERQGTWQGKPCSSEGPSAWRSRDVRLLRHLLACCPPQPALLEGLGSVLTPQPQN